MSKRRSEQQLTKDCVDEDANTTVVSGFSKAPRNILAARPIARARKSRLSASPATPLSQSPSNGVNPFGFFSPNKTTPSMDNGKPASTLITSSPAPVFSFGENATPSTAAKTTTTTTTEATGTPNADFHEIVKVKSKMDMEVDENESSSISKVNSFQEEFYENLTKLNKAYAESTAKWIAKEPALDLVPFFEVYKARREVLISEYFRQSKSLDGTNSKKIKTTTSQTASSIIVPTLQPTKMQAPNIQPTSKPFTSTSTQPMANESKTGDQPFKFGLTKVPESNPSNSSLGFSAKPAQVPSKPSMTVLSDEPVKPDAKPNSEPTVKAPAVSNSPFMFGSSGARPKLTSSKQIEPPKPTPSGQLPPSVPSTAFKFGSTTVESSKTVDQVAQSTVRVEEPKILSSSFTFAKPVNNLPSTPSNPFAFGISSSSGKDGVKAPTATSMFAEPKVKEKSGPSKFSFGPSVDQTDASKAETKQPSFTSSATASGKTSNSPFSFSSIASSEAPKISDKTFSFGSPAQTSSQMPSRQLATSNSVDSALTSSTTTATIGNPFSFGTFSSSQKTDKRSKPSVAPSEIPVTKGSTTTADQALNKPSSLPSIPFNFGQGPSTAKEIPKESNAGSVFGEEKAKTGSTSSSSGFTFGAPSVNKDASKSETKPSGVDSTGMEAKKEPSASLSFGSNVAAETPKNDAKPFVFGSTPQTISAVSSGSPFSFGNTTTSSSSVGSKPFSFASPSATPGKASISSALLTPTGSDKKPTTGTLTSPGSFNFFTPPTTVTPGVFDHSKKVSFGSISGSNKATVGFSFGPSPTSSSGKEGEKVTNADEKEDEETGGSAAADLQEDALEGKDEDGSDEFLKRGQGEEDEETKYETRARVYRYKPNEKKWDDLGVTYFKVNVNPKTDVRRVLARTAHNGKAVVNFRLFKEMAPTCDRTFVTFVGVDENQELRPFRCKLKTLELATQTADALKKWM